MDVASAEIREMAKFCRENLPRLRQVVAGNGIFIGWQRWQSVGIKLCQRKSEINNGRKSEPVRKFDGGLDALGVTTPHLQTANNQSLTNKADEHKDNL